jgi:hypothetical protein
MPFFALANLLPAAVLSAVGILVTLLAHLVRNGNVEALSGYNADKVTDKAGLAGWAGSNLLLLGGFQIAAGLLVIISPPVGSSLFFLATVALAGRTFFGGRRFRH